MVAYCQQKECICQAAGAKKLAQVVGIGKSKGKMKTSRSGVKAVTGTYANVTISDMDYQYHNWQTQNQRIAEITQQRRRQMLGERGSVEIEASIIAGE
jgi:hypothetical protein